MFTYDVVNDIKVANIRAHASMAAADAAANQPADAGVDLMAERTDGQFELVDNGFIIVNVSSVGTGGTLDLIVQDTNDGTTWDTDYITVDQITAAGLYVIPIVGCHKKIRLNGNATTDAVVWGATFVGGPAKKRPVVQAATTLFPDLTYGTGR